VLAERLAELGDTGVSRAGRVRVPSNFPQEGSST